MEEVPGPALLPYSLNIYYGTQTGTAKIFAEQLASDAKGRGIEVATFDLKECDPEDTLTLEVREREVIGVSNIFLSSLFIVP